MTEAEITAQLEKAGMPDTRVSRTATQVVESIAQVCAVVHNPDAHPMMVLQPMTNLFLAAREFTQAVRDHTNTALEACAKAE